MAIPGKSSTDIEIRDKVRVGEKSERGLPRSVDHFLSPDPEVGKGKKDLRILLVHAEPEDAFRTGLEWWKGELLACYSSEGGSDPTAMRVSRMETKTGVINLLDSDDEVRGEPVGKGRSPIKCKFRQCRHFGTNAGNKECRVKGRLTFLVDGGRTDSALLFETKGWKTIEKIEATLASCRRSGPLNAPGRVFILSVRVEQDGNKKHPVVTIQEDNNVEVSTETIPLADSLVTLRRYVETEGTTDAQLKQGIADALDNISPGWRDDKALIEGIQARIAELGVVGAAQAILLKYEPQS